MVKTKHTSVLVKDGIAKRQELWEPDRGDSDLDVPEWRDEDETTQPNIPNSSEMQSG